MPSLPLQISPTYSQISPNQKSFLCIYLNQTPYDYTVEVTNRFKGLDLIDRMPEELWMEVCDIVQEAGIKAIPKKKKYKKAKWLSEEALQIAEKRKDVKGKGQKERLICMQISKE